MLRVQSCVCAIPSATIPQPQPVGPSVGGALCLQPAASSQHALPVDSGSGGGGEGEVAHIEAHAQVGKVARVGVRPSHELAPSLTRSFSRNSSTARAQPASAT